MPRFIKLVLLLAAVALVDQKLVSVHFQRVEQSSNAQYILMNASLSDKGGLNMEVQILRQISRVHAQIEIILLKYLGEKDMTVMNRTVNHCRVKKNEGRELLWRIVVDMVAKFGNMTVQCPFYPGTYYLHELTINDYDMPNYIPDATFRFNFQIFEENDIGDLVQILKLSCSGRVDKSRMRSKLPKFFAS